jgi:hypothetical protein
LEEISQGVKDKQPYKRTIENNITSKEWTHICFLLKKLSTFISFKKQANEPDNFLAQYFIVYHSYLPGRAKPC